MGFKVGAVAQR